MAKALPARLIGSLATFALATAIFGTPAQSEVRVIQSSVTSIVEGSVLENDAILDVPKNASIKVLIAPANIIKVIIGPYKGTAGSYTSKMLPSASAKPPEVVDPGMLATSPPPADR